MLRIKFEINRSLRLHNRHSSCGIYCDIASCWHEPDIRVSHSHLPALSCLDDDF